MPAAASPPPTLPRLPDPLEADRRHVWHPFTQMREYYDVPPVAIASGRGGWLTDTEGRAYLDGNASIWTNVHGHNDPDLNAALERQLRRVAHATMLGLTHAPGAELAAELAGLAPAGLTRVFFSDNGAGAVEVALKLSFQYWQLRGRPAKRGVIGMAGGYHGDTFGAMAAGDSGFFHDRFRPWCFPASHFPAPRCRELAGRVHAADGAASLAGLRRLLAERGAETACLILEPSVQGAAGMRQQPPGFTAEVAALCRAHEVHLILDEVFVAFGRLGPMLVCTEENVTPDFLCLAKGLTAGYLPLAATLAQEEIFSAFLGSYASGRAFYHGHTFTGNPLGAAVALENIRKLRPLIAGGALAARAAAFGRRLEEKLAGHPGVAEVRQRGFAAAVDLRPAPTGGTRCPPRVGSSPGPDERVEDNPLHPSRRVGLEACLRARGHGLLLRPLGDSLLLVPPLCLSPAEMAAVVDRTAAALDEIFPS